jgi:hypothetical protein
MKKLFTILSAIILTATLWAQSPQKMSYQAVIRNSSDQLVTNQPIGMQITILQGSASGTAVYTETQTPTTNANGLVSIEIGGEAGFDAIDWANGPYFIKTETDPTGGANYTITGTSQLLSVPYALHAKTAENGFSGSYNDLTDKPTGNNAGEIQYWDGTAWVMMTVGQPGQFLQLTASNIPAWSGTTSTLTTLAASSIAGTYVTTGGNITNDGGSTVTERGVCWNTSANPTITNSKTSDGTGKGIFTSSISGLTMGATYYVRAYSINSLGTAYGNEVNFTTLTLAVLTTTEASSITNTTVITGGNITNDGGAAVSARGVCWNTSANPTTADNKTTNGNDKGVFQSSITGLTMGTTYYVRAYATNSIGTSYGNEISFTTISLPVLTTLAVSSLAGTYATTGGNITNDGGALITNRGVCWSTSVNPTIANSKTTEGIDTGTFSSSLTGLAVNTKYYYRSYASNSTGTAYGNEISFTTPATTPTLTTKFASTLGTEAVGSTATAVSGGNITFDGGAAVTARGVCWNTNGNPTIADSKNTVGTGTGIFPSSISGLILDHLLLKGLRH